MTSAEEEEAGGARGEVRFAALEGVRVRVTKKGYLRVGSKVTLGFM